MSGLVGRFAFCLLLLGFLASSEVGATGSGSLRLSGQVDPQLNVTTTLDWVHGTLRVDNASNMENESFWIDVGSGDKIRLDRTAIVDLNSWTGRSPAFRGKQLQVTIASP